MAQTTTLVVLGEPTKQSWAEAVYDDITDLYAQVAALGGASSGARSTVSVTSQTITSSTYVDVSGCSFTLTGVAAASELLVIATGTWDAEAAVGSVGFKLWIDGDESSTEQLLIPAAGNQDAPFAIHHFKSGHGGGSVDIKLRAKSDSSGDLRIVKARLTAVEL